MFMKIVSIHQYHTILFLFFLSAFCSCTNNNATTEAEVVNGEEAISLMQVEEGFEVRLVAAEPLVVAPVAMCFDKHGRLWVVEMTGYMPDTAGRGEEHPNGKIIILEDEDGDGKMDTRKLFLDSLVLPRAISFVENGLLVAEPPYLWYFEIDNDLPVNKIVVDSAYAVGGNAEHQPNGLYRAVDNWIYSATGNYRYKKQGEVWLKEPALKRGQWGISQDDIGRLFYNNNSQNMLGDFFPAAFISSRGFQPSVKGFNERVVKDNRVYPIRPTPGVNRGYMEGILDEELKLVNFTAASGPVIYRGQLFPDEFYGNAFVGEPAAHLIKRNILQYGDTVSGVQAYESKEFLASTDERFRPVTMYNGPDGALYFADMYRGIIQHKTYLTPYLKDHIVSKGLSFPLNCGRIYKVIPKNASLSAPDLSLPANKLLPLLKHPNGWVRDKVQQLLIDNRQPELIPAIKEILFEVNNPIAVKYHAAWVLESYGALAWMDVQKLLETGKQERRLAFSLLSSLHKNINQPKLLAVLQNLLPDFDVTDYTWMVYALNQFPEKSRATKQLILEAAKKFRNNEMLADAVVYALRNEEENSIRVLNLQDADSSLLLKKLSHSVFVKKAREEEKLQSTIAEKFPEGAALYKKTCQVCHGETGRGIEAMAPALNRSALVNGNVEQLIIISLLGIEPEKIEGKPSEYGEMPGIWSNNEINSENLAELLSFIKHSWQNKGGMVTADQINKVKSKLEGESKKPVKRSELGKMGYFKAD